MAGQSNAAPVIIKRKKIVQEGGHHGGAWKVAYADFVTAMMAFFLLMWLLNATTEKQRKGLADYFSPSIPVNRISGGGEGAFGGDSVFSEDELIRDGTGGTDRASSESDRSRGDSAESEALNAAIREEMARLRAKGGESLTMERALRHIVSRVTEEGLVIEVFDLPGVPLFAGDTAEPAPVLDTIAALLAETLAIATNRLAINAHVRAFPITLIDNPSWALTTARAQAMRALMERHGLAPGRSERVSGFADRRPVAADPDSLRNNRLEIILLRRDR